MSRIAVSLIPGSRFFSRERKAPKPIELAQQIIGHRVDMPELDIRRATQIKTSQELLAAPSIRRLAKESPLAKGAYDRLNNQLNPSHLQSLINRLSYYLSPLSRFVLRPDGADRTFIETKRGDRNLMTEAIRTENESAVLVLLDWDFDLASIPPASLEQMVCVAGQRGWDGLLNRLLAFDSSLMTASYQDTSLLTATLAGGHEKMAESLVDRGASVGDQAAILATKKVGRELVRKILSKVDIQTIGFELMEAAIQSGVALNIQLLIELGIDPDVKNGQGKTPLHTAVKYKNPNLANELIFWGADLDVQDSAGKTPLMLAQHAGHVEITRRLLARGANTNLKDKQGIPLAEQVNRNPNKTITSFFYQNQELWKERTTIPFLIDIEKWNPAPLPERSLFGWGQRGIQMNIAILAAERGNKTAFLEAVGAMGVDSEEGTLLYQAFVVDQKNGDALPILKEKLGKVLGARPDISFRFPNPGSYTPQPAPPPLKPVVFDEGFYLSPGLLNSAAWQAKGVEGVSDPYELDSIWQGFERTLIKMGAPAESAKREGALLFAIFSKNKRLIASALQEGARLDGELFPGYTVLRLARRRHSRPALRGLLVGLNTKSKNPVE